MSTTVFKKNKQTNKQKAGRELFLVNTCGFCIFKNAKIVKYFHKFDMLLQASNGLRGRMDVVKKKKMHHGGDSFNTALHRTSDYGD